jgi:hypothetical protein
MMIDWQSLVKYILEGMAVAVASWLIPSNKMSHKDIIVISLTASAVFAILDQFTPLVADGARQGTGFAIGYQQVGLGLDPSVEDNNDIPEKDPQEMDENTQYCLS